MNGSKIANLATRAEVDGQTGFHIVQAWTWKKELWATHLDRRAIPPLSRAGIYYLIAPQYLLLYVTPRVYKNIARYRAARPAAQ